MTIFGNKEIVTNKKTKIKKERVAKEPKLKLEKSASATASGKNGKDYQELIWKLFTTTTLLFDLTGLRIENLIDIDSKDPTVEFNMIRHKLDDKFHLNNKFNFISRFTSSFRGDILLLLDELNKIILDLKNYSGIQSKMKFPTFMMSQKNNFMKGIDSNNNYLLSKLDNEFYHEDLVKFRNICFEKDNNKYQELVTKYSGDENIKICTISSEKLIELVYFMEIGYAWHYLEGVKRKKRFISKSKNTLEYIEFDLEKYLTKKEIDVIFRIDKKTQYAYIEFFEGDRCVYISSQRAAKENFIGNCSFLNRNYCEILNTANLEDYI